MMKRGKRLAAAIGLSIMLVCTMMPSAAFAAPREVPQGHKHVDIDIYEVPGKSAEETIKSVYPSKLDPRTDSRFKQYVKVKNQAYTNMCWAYSTTTAAEASWVNEHGSTQQLSPAQLAYFFYNRANDPLGNTKNDFNENYPGYNWVTEGGSCVFTGIHLSTYSGLALESLMPLPGNTINTKAKVAKLGKKKYSKSLAYEDALTLENSVYYAHSDVNTVKGLIEKYGGVVVSMDASAEYFADENMDNAAVYKPDAYDQDNNHEVALVGWDDNYPKEEFDSYSEEEGDWVQPMNDGAWIMQNSWGTTDAGDNGYYYVSYESTDILADGILALDLQPADTYDHIFQYDGNAFANCYDNLQEISPLYMEAGEKAANVFVSEGTNTLKAVGMTEWNLGATNYSIEVYTGLTDRSDPYSGVKKLSQNISTSTPGFKTFKLDKPVMLNAGEAYAIVVTFKTKTNMGVEASDDNGHVAGLAKNQSLYLENGYSYWQDAYKDGFCFRIKGLANTAMQPTSITSLKRAKKALTVKWTERPEFFDGGNIDGYEVRYSTRSNMSGAKTVDVWGFRNTSVKLTGLKSKKKYYVQVRTYSQPSGTKWYSAWSPTKSAKTK